MSAAHLEAAVGIGDRLVAEAIWHEGRCNWVGASPQEGPGGSLAITYSALGPDLYGGTSGVALFLAELYRATGERDLKRTARGALRQALSSSTELPEGVRPSLYGGGLGIALAAALLGRIFDDEEAISGALWLADVEPQPGGEWDLMGGDAGTILALLALGGLLGEEEGMRSRAIQFGANLLAGASAEEGILSWSSPGLSGTPSLTGLSHGASGCGLAFLELWQQTGEPSFLAAAQGAFAYERTLFDPQAANWPDLRNETPGVLGRRSFVSLWCHGAPGISLARLRALELGDGNGPLRDEALSALATTRRAVETELAQGGNFSLCHGMAGNAEILREGALALGEERAKDDALALQVAEEGIERYGAPGHPWPCGTFEGETPGLFLGLAGIGRFYLRLHQPELPSLLAPRPADLAAAGSA
jgi:lantibiotic biosynthesis protein